MTKPPGDPGSHIITVAQAAVMAGLSPTTWAKLRKMGSAPPTIRLSERRIGHRLGDVTAWIEARTERAA